MIRNNQIFQLYPENEMTLSCNGKTKVAFDYNTDITGKESLTFKAINTSVCVCVCVCVRARARVHVCTCICHDVNEL